MLEIQDSLRDLEVGRRCEDDARNRAFEERKRVLWEVRGGVGGRGCLG